MPPAHGRCVYEPPPPHRTVQGAGLAPNSSCVPSMQDALFVPSAAAMLVGVATYSLFARPEPIDFDDPALAVPFAWEERVLGLLPTWLREKLDAGL